SRETATSCTSALSLHDALPISEDPRRGHLLVPVTLLDLPGEVLERAVQNLSLRMPEREAGRLVPEAEQVEFAAKLAVIPLGCLLDRKSTRLNSSHVKISYAVFC